MFGVGCEVWGCLCWNGVAESMVWMCCDVVRFMGVANGLEVLDGQQRRGRTIVKRVLAKTWRWTSSVWEDRLINWNGHLSGKAVCPGPDESAIEAWQHVMP